ncbi:MAG: hypothetical protein P4M08_13050 [Oligoflexia bacterium]|nr:hypothetical protein [Oligoflexia bacterium]
MASDRKSVFRVTLKNRDLPSTQGMLDLVRTELKSDVKAGFHEVNARLHEMNARFEAVDSRFERIESKIDKLSADVTRGLILAEEQRAENRVVLEGLTGLFQRQERVERRVDDVEAFVRSVKEKFRLCPVNKQ